MVLAVRGIIQMVAEPDQHGHSAAEGDLRATLFAADRHRIDQAGRVTHGGSSLEITPANHAGYALTDNNDGDGRGNPIDMEPFTGATGQLWAAPQGGSAHPHAQSQECARLGDG
jgi:hypothetical protein